MDLIIVLIIFIRSQSRQVEHSVEALLIVGDLLMDVSMQLVVILEIILFQLAIVAVSQLTKLLVGQIFSLWAKLVLDQLNTSLFISIGSHMPLLYSPFALSLPLDFLLLLPLLGHDWLRLWLRHGVAHGIWVGT